MTHRCGTRLVITHSCEFKQVTYCPRCQVVKEQPKRLSDGRRTLSHSLFIKAVAAVYYANEGMRLRKAINIVEAVYPRHSCYKSGQTYDPYRLTNEN